MYLLLDANVTAGYYLPLSLDRRKAIRRIENIFDSKRSGSTNHFFYIPNFCIAEVFSVFMKYAFGYWNKHVERKGGTLHGKVYSKLVRQFQDDIHNGRFIHQYELSRYHVLGINHVAPVDHHYQMTRGGKKRHSPMATMDHLIISMGIQLVRIHGAENVVIVSADKRLCDSAKKCRSGLKPGTIKKLKVITGEQLTGVPFCPASFPRVINLGTAKDQELIALFGQWPLPVGKVPNVYRHLSQ